MKLFLMPLVFCYCCIVNAQTYEVPVDSIIGNINSLLDTGDIDKASQALNDAVNKYVNKSLYDELIPLSIINAKVAFLKNGINEVENQLTDWENDILSNVKSKKTKFEYYSDIATFFRGEYFREKQLEYYKLAFEASKDINPIDSALYYSSARNIAASFADLGDYEQSYKMVLPAYNFFAKHKDSFAKYFVDVSNTLAVNYRAQNKLEESLLLNKETNRLIKSQPNAFEDPNFISSVIYNNISNVYFQKGDYFNGIENSENAVLTMKKALDNIDKNNPKFPTYQQYYYIMRINLAGNYSFILDSQKELQISESSYKQLQTILPLGHPLLNQVMLSYAEVLVYNDRLEDAKTIFDLINLDHLESKANLAEYYYLAISYYIKLGDCDKALTYFNTALPIFIDYHTKPLITLIRLMGDCFLTADNNPDKALSFIQGNPSKLHEGLQEEERFFLTLYEVDYLSSAGHLDKALNTIKNIESYVDTESLKAYKPFSHYLKFYVLKAKTLLFKSPDDIAILKESYAAINKFINLYRELKRTDFNLYNSDISQDLLKEGEMIGLQVLSALYQQTDDAQYLYEIIKLSDQLKMTHLSGRLTTIQSFHKLGIAKELYDEEQKLIRQLQAMDNNANDFSIEKFTDTKAQLTNLADSIKKQYPKYAQVRYSESIVDIKNVVKEFLTDDNAIIHYQFINEKLQALLITQNEIQQIILADYEYSTNINLMLGAIKKLDFEQFKLHSAELYELLLKPIKEKTDKTTFVIVPDRSLHKINFEFLAPKSDAKNFKDLPFAIYQNTFSYLYAYDVYSKMKSIKTTTNDNIVAFAPGFNASSKEKYRSKVSDSSLIDRDFLYAIQQPFSVNTINLIKKKYDIKSFTNDFASEKEFRNNGKNSNILHLASHSIYSENPLLSKILFAKDDANDLVDITNDGNLYFHEIYQLNIDSDLTILLSCETGVGEEALGEGLLSLSHSFLYAGCPTLISSLWTLDEKQSNAIINAFYSQLSDKKNISEALRQAKLDYLNSVKQPELAAPFYWAGLIVQGEATQTIALSEKKLPLWQIILLGIVSLVIIVLLFKKFYNK